MEKMELVKQSLPEFTGLIMLNGRQNIDAQTLAIQELEYLNGLAISKPELLECLPVSIITCIKSVLKNNLTLDPSANLVYVKTRNMNTKNEQGQEVWVKVMEVQQTYNGKLSVARQCGTIIDFKNPEVEFDNDGKVKSVSFEILRPSGNSTRWEKYTYSEYDFLRWQTASHKENSRNKQGADINTLNYSSAMYRSWKGGIDPEFAKAKAINHSLKKLGTNVNEAMAKKIVIENKIVEIENSAAEAADYEDLSNKDQSNISDTTTFIASQL